MSQPAITLHLHLHQPWRLRQYRVFDIARQHDYFVGGHDPAQDNRQIFQKVANKSYRPMNALLSKLLREQPQFRFSLSLSGVFLEQAEQFAPDVIIDLQQLVATGRVELLALPYHHSLAFFYSLREFEAQLQAQQQKIQQLFGVTSRVLMNTELAYDNRLGHWAEQHGFRGVLVEGWEPTLGQRQPGMVYQPPETQQVGLLLRHYRLSDDIAFRFSDQQWSQWPLTAERFQDWLESAGRLAPLINLFMDYETFGEHQWADSGIFDFFEQLVRGWLESEGRFYTVSQALDSAPSGGQLDLPQTVTWADSQRDLTAWNGNQLQTEALRYLYELEDAVWRSGDAALLEDWRRLQTSDHLYYMSTKWLADGDVHAYFSPYESPYDAFLYYMNALRDLRWRLAH